MKKLSRFFFSLALAFVASAPAAAEDKHAEDLFKYEKVAAPVIGTSIPGLNLVLPGKSGYFGLQYGPAKDDVAYVALEYSAAKGTYETLYIYAAKDSRYASAFRVRGSRSWRRAVTFRSFALKTRFGEVDAEFDVELTAEGTTVKLLAVCTLNEADRRLCRFDLAGTVDPGLGADRPAEITRLLGVPEVTCTLDHRSSPPKLAGNLKMGKWSLLPENKMPCKVTATLTSAEGERAVKESAKLDEMDRGRFRFSPTRRMLSGKTYEAEVSVDLGPFFGVLEIKKQLTPRKI